MSWMDRIREAAYNSPQGTRQVFHFENVREAFDKKTAAFDFVDADGTYVQDNGHTGRRIPLRLFFWGDDYDLESDAFEELLKERGTAKIEHPVYGVIDVVPFGTIARRDDLKTAANQAIWEITFWETIGLLFPSAQSDPASEVLTAIDEYGAATAEEFEEVTSLKSAVEQVTFKNVYSALLDSVSSGLQDIADVQDDVRQQFNAIVDSVNQGIDTLVAEPLNLAFQTVLLIQAPARALTAIGARIDAYNTLANSIITGDGAVISPGNDSRNSNEFHTKDLYASSYVTGSVLSVVNNQFTTKPEAITAAEAILAQLEAVTNWRDDNFESLAEVDTGAAYQKLQEAVALAAGFLVEISFSLKQERSVVLDRARTIVDLSAELYGSVDDQLDFLITSNDLSGSEVLELPEGREIVYYV